ncbi:MAG: hypothetical protein ACD_41C00177G0009 [uncultured bacterium]|nr:MAG: hypothetical protein ACD_41C00177G0009 [uncultured bacterium]HBY73288.1 23S rRNA (pseudouridine(1915)-N(3))-methyltransferase RlmH [Candidatus Kerfeldbacteria bacterium]
MFQFQVIAVSKPTGPWRELLELYHERLIHLARFQFTAIQPEKMGANVNRAQVIEREGERIIKALPKECVIIACDEQGKAYDSSQFVERLEHWSIQQTEPIVFVIGGPFGLSPAVTQVATSRLALAAWTLPHDLAVTVLLEQLYRACTIVTGKVYHY